MENDILDSLNDLGYQGPLTDEGAFSKALEGGPKSLEFTKLVHILAEELKSLCQLEETVSMMNDPDESSSFLLELSSFLKELGCPYKKLVIGHMSARLQSTEDRLLLLDYLISELMAARMARVDSPKEKTSSGMNIIMQESPTAKDLKDILISLKFNKPPPNITPEMLFTKLEAKLKDTIQKEGEQLVGKPLYNKALSEKDWKQLDTIFTEMYEEYRLRRETLITRLECTIQSFEWSERLKNKKDLIQSTYRPKKEQMKVKPDVKLSDFLAARTSLLTVEKTSSASVRKNTQSDVTKVIIGQVPDRGGRPNEQQPPPPEMPSWQQRSTGRQVTFPKPITQCDLTQATQYFSDMTVDSLSKRIEENWSTSSRQGLGAVQNPEKGTGVSSTLAGKTGLSRPQKQTSLYSCDTIDSLTKRIEENWSPSSRQGLGAVQNPEKGTGASSTLAGKTGLSRKQSALFSCDTTVDSLTKSIEENWSTSSRQGLGVVQNPEKGTGASSTLAGKTGLSRKQKRRANLREKQRQKKLAQNTETHPSRIGTVAEANPSEPWEAHKNMPSGKNMEKPSPGQNTLYEQEQSSKVKAKRTSLDEISPGGNTKKQKLMMDASETKYFTEKRIAITSASTGRITEDTSDLIIYHFRKQLFIHIHSDLSKRGPTFWSKPIFYDGSLTLICADDFTVNWVKWILRDLILGGENLIVIESEIPCMVKARLYIPEVWREDEANIGKYLCIANQWAQVERWQLQAVYRNADAGRTLVVVNIPKDIVPEIVGRGCRVGFLIGSLRIRFGDEK